MNHLMGVRDAGAAVVLVALSLCGALVASPGRAAAQEIVLNDRTFEVELERGLSAVERRARAVLAELGLESRPHLSESSRSHRRYRFTDGERVVELELRSLRTGVTHLRVRADRVSQMPDLGLEVDARFGRDVIERITRSVARGGWSLASRPHR